MNCSICPYSQEAIGGMIELNKPPSNGQYCKLGFPIECRQGRLPRELQEVIDREKEGDSNC